MCRIFAAKLFDLMGWDGGYCYKVMGNPAVYGEEMLFLFQQTDFELFLGEKKPRSYLPGEWRDYFGTPAELHGWNMERSYRVPDMVAQEALWVVFHLDKA